MTAAPDQSRTLRLLRQHARSLQLLGVDFVPVTGGVPRSAATGPLDPPAAPSERPVPRQAGATPARVAPQQPAPAAPVTLVEPKSAPRIEYEDAPRIEAQRLLDDIRARYEKDAPHKHFVTDHHAIVFGEGDPRARLMFIGEAPGAEEDKCGRPFVGRAGQLLDKMIEAMGLRRQDVYIANVLKTRPPGNATPTMDECARCAPYLFEQIRAVKPEVIVTLGLPATRVMLNTMDSMGNLRGKWSAFPPPGVLAPPGESVPVMPTYHPAFLLRSYTKENRAKVWADLQMAAKRLGLVAPSRGAGQA